MPLVKASACGNDFLIIEGMHAPPDLVASTRRLCDRHNGVGADGVEWLFPTPDADIRARLLNADGSEAEISGNGTRCVAAYLCCQESRQRITVRTGAGIRTCSLTARHQMSFEFETEMGDPQLGDEFSIKVAFGEVRGVPVSMGNPHFVVFVDQFAPGWQGDAAEIAKHHDFQYGINVELVHVRDPENLEVRFYERGVGETQSSGTGSCAAAVAAISHKKTISSVLVHAPGGTQRVRWNGQVFLRGPAQIIFRGEFLV
ncbi:MAG: diaminopimelate epimerase [Acidobacteria bacterium]|nr:diaminopimelate epimerase [Acidobacteriota bacterium]